ncbi:MAG TPA: hypothetical protein VKZ18_23710 [Polyangia bacterium]|nr:hypothetical protein [Polyangia bacterium]
MREEVKRAPRGGARSAKPRGTAKPRLATVSGELREGFVVGVNPVGSVRAELAAGPRVDALCPSHIDPQWLAAAAKVAPIAAVFLPARPSGRYVLFGLFPSRAQAEVRVDVTIRGRQVRVEADEVSVASRNARLALDPEGNVSLRGRDVTSHARRVNRIKGGAIRLN